MTKKKKEEIDMDAYFNKEYKTLGDLIEHIPTNMMVFKRNVEIFERETKLTHNLLVLIYRILGDESPGHFSDRTIAFMRVKDTGVMRKVDQLKLRQELADLLLKHLDSKAFMNDFVLTLSPIELLEAYDRAIVKKGKVKDTHGCYKFKIYGQKGAPMELMLRN